MIQIEIPAYGAPEVLRLIEKPDPEPAEGQVRVAVKAAGINFADIMARMGLYRDAPKPPMVVGYEVSGLIDKVGRGVDSGRIGQKVLAMTRFGGYSTKALVQDENALEIPRGMGFEAAAALPVNYLTAYHMLIRLGNLQSGDRVLIHSAGGGVGIASIQLARWKSAEIFGTASSWKHPRLQEMGVKHCIDYTKQDFEVEIDRLTSGRGVTIALDAVGGASFKTSFSSLGKTGRLFCFGVSAFAPGKKRRLLNAGLQLLKMPLWHPTQLLMQNKGVFGINMGDLWEESALMQSEMKALLGLCAEGHVSPVVSEAFPFKGAADAHRYMQERKNFGKVILLAPE